jgi:hypothetical protein
MQFLTDLGKIINPGGIKVCGLQSGPMVQKDH